MGRRKRPRVDRDGSPTPSPPKRTREKRIRPSCLPPDVICSEIFPHFRAEILFGPAMRGELLFFSRLGNRVTEFCTPEWSAPPYAYWRLELYQAENALNRFGEGRCFRPFVRAWEDRSHLELSLMRRGHIQDPTLARIRENIRPFPATGLFGYFKQDLFRYAWFLFRSVYIYRDREMTFSPNIPQGVQFRGRFGYNLDSLQQVVVVRPKQLMSLMFGSHLRGVIPEKLRPMPQLEFFSCHPRLISKCRGLKLLSVPRLEILIDEMGEVQQAARSVFQNRLSKLKWNVRQLHLRSSFSLTPLDPTFFSGDMATIRKLDLFRIVIAFPLPELPNLTHFISQHSNFRSNRVFFRLKGSLEHFAVIPDSGSLFALPPSQCLRSLRCCVLYNIPPPQVQVPVEFSRTVFAENRLHVLCVRSSSSLMDFADLPTNLEVLRLDLRDRDPKPTLLVKSLVNLRILVLVNVVLRLESEDGRPRKTLEFLGFHEAKAEVLLPGNLVRKLEIDAEKTREGMSQVEYYGRL